MDKGRKHIVVIFLLASILFVVFCGILYSQHKVAQYYSDDTLKSYETIRRVRIIYINILNLETGQRGYLLTRDKEFLEPYDLATRTLDEQIQLLENASLSPEQALLIKSIKTNVRMLDESLKQQMTLRDINKFEPRGLQDFYSNKQIMDSLRSDLERFSDLEKNQLFTGMANLKEQQDNYLLTLMLGTIFAISSLFIANAIIMGLISKSKKMESELRANEERFSRVMNAVNDGVFDYDYENKKAYFSPSYKKMLGYEENEIENTMDAFKDMVHPDDFESANKRAEDYMARKIPTYNNVFRMRHKNESWIWILSRGVGIWDKNGKIKRLMGSHTDITEQKDREEELKQLNTDLEGFTYLASHDLRSPLVNLKGFAGEIKYVLKEAEPIIQKAKAKLENEEKEKFEATFEHEIPEALGYISTAVEKMDKLTSAILDLSKIGKREFKFVKIDTADIVKRSVDALKFEIDKKNITVDIRNLPVIKSDPVAIEQVFGNIIDNAVKYMVPERAGKISIDSFNAGYYTIFTIQDNGRGIAATDHKRVFDFFRRAANSSDVRGSGMGMAFVKATVRKLGGNIWFESQLGEGTCFYFSIPKKAGKEA